MKIIGQPESYSDMLERIFVFTLATGVICVFWLSFSSSDVKAIFDAISTEAEIGMVKKVKALYVLIPLAIAILSRVIRLHDKISDLLYIRQRFDTNNILIPLAQKVGYSSQADLIKKNRIDMMYKVFYPFAGFKVPIIDAQLVRSALDNWGWFWVALESCFLFIISSIIFLMIGRIAEFFISLGVMLLLISFGIYQYQVCIKSATAEVNAIVSDDVRKNEILNSFSSFE